MELCAIVFETNTIANYYVEAKLLHMIGCLASILSASDRDAN